MFLACSNNDFEQVKKCIAQGESVNKHNEQPYFENGWSSIRYAALAGNKNDSQCQIDIIIENAKKIITLLIENGADINHRDVDGVTTLMSVSQFKRRINLVRFLLAAGANKNIKDINNKKACDYAGSVAIKQLITTSV